jgi:hypothetical protein
MTFDETYTALFGARSPDELVANWDLRQVELDDWLGSYCLAVIHRASMDERTAVARGIAQHWPDLLAGLSEAIARREDAVHGDPR